MGKGDRVVHGAGLWVGLGKGAGNGVGLGSLSGSVYVPVPLVGCTAPSCLAKLGMGAVQNAET